ncbi:MAG TPA: hypothetical protein VKS79_05200 [Gemmataceae bacterium]|nr:hypothetical protein [Gemmataceae bacterium]
MNTTNLLRTIIATSAAFVILVPPPGLARAQKDEELDFFIDQAGGRTAELNRLTKDVNGYVKDVNQHIKKMHFSYDEIVSLGPSEYRQKMVTDYEYERAVVYAANANMDPVLRKLKDKIPGNKNFRDAYLRFKNEIAYKDLNNALFDAQLAVVAAGAVELPPALPIPLASEDSDSVEVTAAKILATGKLQPGKTYECEVTVHCNRVYTGATATIEARVREGPAELVDAANKDVTLKAQETKTLKWKFKVTDGGGQIRVSAKVASCKGLP